MQLNWLGLVRISIKENTSVRISTVYSSHYFAVFQFPSPIYLYLNAAEDLREAFLNTLTIFKS